ncbi:MAG: thioesterase family protein [Candidatus Methylomirabilia bacterium]
MTFEGIRPGLKATRQALVTKTMVTTHAGGQRGGVLTTPAMIGIMETTAQAATQPYLPSDHTTVGFEVAVRHLAPTPLGARITVSTELLEVDGRKLFFRAEAYNEREKIGEGTLRRTIVQLGSLEPRRD